MSINVDAKMKDLNRKFRIAGLIAGLLSGLLYGVYSTLAILAGESDPLIAATGMFAIAFVISGVNDTFAGIWLLFYNLKAGKLKELKRTVDTFPGKIGIVGALVGGPIANGAYLVGLSLAGAYAIPISATCSLFGALFAWFFLKQKPNKRVVLGMIVCVVGAIIINWVTPEDSPNFTLGIIAALVAAIAWGLEGVISSYGGSMLDTDVTVNIREIVSGVVTLVLAVVLFNGSSLLSETVVSIRPMLILAVAGLSAGMSFLFWYKANAKVGCAIGMSLNVTYAFWGVLFCVLFLNTELTPAITIGSLVIICGAILVTMNPLDLIKKKEA